MRSRNCVRCDRSGGFLDMESNRLWTYCPRCREVMFDRGRRVKGMELKHMKKYGSGRITEPSDADYEQPELPFEKTASRDEFTPQDEVDLVREQLSDADHDR